MKKVISISLAILLLTSNLSLAIGTHYCGGLAVKTELMFGHQHLDCGMSGMDGEHSDKDGNTKIERIPCCQNEYSSFESNDAFKIPSQLSNTVNFEFVVAFLTILLNPVWVEETVSYRFQYPPPLLDKDIQVLFQTFLI